MKIMLKRFEVTNYRKFKETLVLDLSKVGGYKFNNECIMGDVLGKIIIYGRNASGKTCIGKALVDILAIVNNTRLPFDGYILNASASEEYAQFVYVFQFNNKEVKYCYKRISEFLLLDEAFYVNGERAFYYNYKSGEYDISNVNLLEIESESVVNFIAKKENIKITQEIVQVPFMRWANTNVIIGDNALIKKLFTFALGINVQGVNLLSSVMSHKSDIYSYLSKKELVDDFERFLQSCGINIKLNLVNNPTGLPELYVIYDNKMLPFLDTASSGTLALTNFYYRFVSRRVRPSLIFFDEFDAFLHYEMADSIVDYFKKNYQDTQVILTTHDTNLMSNHIMRPDCLLILSSEGNLTALCDATERELREGHNLEKMYISGEFSKYE